jgi:hypothetical protein
MPESFTPLVPAREGSHEAVFTSFLLKGSPPKTTQAALTAPGAAGSGSETCAKPVVTLQRKGDIVCGIRIQCGCGQVVELACVY